MGEKDGRRRQTDGRARSVMRPIRTVALKMAESSIQTRTMS